MTSAAGSFRVVVAAAVAPNTLMGLMRAGPVVAPRELFWITDGAGRQYAVNAAGQRTKLIHGPDTTTYTCGASRDLSHLTVRWGDANAAAIPTRTIAFTWDGLGRRRTVTFLTTPAVTAHYRYDKLGLLRRLKVTRPGGPMGSSPSRGLQHICCRALCSLESLLFRQSCPCARRSVHSVGPGHTPSSEAA